MSLKQRITEHFGSLQDRITGELERLDGKERFRQDEWEREGGGGGRTRVLEEGAVIEKGGVNLSAVQGALSENLAEELNTDPGQDFYATGVSLIIHHRNPYLPIFHMNVRYFELSQGSCWFGGGIDMTPIYIDTAEAGRFHRQLKAVCDRHDPAYYPDFKEWADDYFYLSHREETRGVGGIFFDRLTADGTRSIEQCSAFVQELGERFLPIYKEVLEPKRERSWGDEEEAWQKLRRSRYVEFNLLHDRGTRFGILSKGRTESILVSMPPSAEWHYRYEPAAGTAEKETQEWLRKGIDWERY